MGVRARRPPRHLHGAGRPCRGDDRSHDVLTHAASHRRWADVDLAPEEPTLHVRQGRVAVTGGSVVDEPKSQRSRRNMPLPA